MELYEFSFKNLSPVSYNCINDTKLQFKIIERLVNEKYIFLVAPLIEFLPERKTILATGFDCKINLNEPIKIFSDKKDEEVNFKTVSFFTKKGYGYRFSLGFKLFTPYPIKAIIRPRSSTFGRKGLIFVDSGVIDNDYFHTVKFTCYSIRDMIVINHKDRIAQLLFFEILNYIEQGKTIFKIVDKKIYNEFDKIMLNIIKTNRKGGYGSTG